MEFIFVMFFLQGIVFGFFCSYIAGEKNRGRGEWFVLGFLFSILAVFALIAVPKLENAQTNEDTFSKEVTITSKQIENVTFEGERVITSLPYQLFLTKRFAIEKNNTLEKYVIGNDVFDTLDNSLNEASSRYEAHLSALSEKKNRLDREAAELKNKQTEERIKVTIQHK